MWMLALWTLLGIGEAGAQETDEESVLGFLEVMGSYGFQFGTTPYVPEDDGSRFQHPLTNGFGLGATGGLQIIPGLFGVLIYEFTSAASREGEIAGVIDEIDGTIHYNTLTAGLRVTRRLGPGRILGEFALGVVFPFSTRLEYRYNEALSQLPVPITGSGSRVDEYSLGVGGQGGLGYQIPFTSASGPYVGLRLGLKSFNTTRDGEVTRFDNFVVDLAPGTLPVATHGRIVYDADGGGAPPTTYSVQDLRAQIVLGSRF